MTKNIPRRRSTIEDIKNACNGRARVPNRRFGMPIKQDVKHIGITGIILAGGRSSRMGTSKEFVKFHGVSMLERMIQIVATVCDDAIVIASQGQRLPKIDVTAYRDKIPHQGPLGGMLVGLDKAKNDICFIISCDMPLLQPNIVY